MRFLDRADAFEFVPAEPCDAVINWHTSFGYAESDERNERMFRRAFEALKSGGRLALDIVNVTALLRSFQRHTVHRGASGGRSVVLVRESEVDLSGGFLRQIWTWFVEGAAPIERESRLRLYLPHNLREMLERCGFDMIEFCGGVGGEPLRLDSPRLICLARKSPC